MCSSLHPLCQFSGKGGSSWCLPSLLPTLPSLPSIISRKEAKPLHRHLPSMLRADAVDDRENQGTPKPKEQYNTVACTVKIPERRRLPRPSCVVVESASSTGLHTPRCLRAHADPFFQCNGSLSIPTSPFRRLPQVLKYVNIIISFSENRRPLFAHGTTTRTKQCDICVLARRG